MLEHHWYARIAFDWLAVHYGRVVAPMHGGLFGGLNQVGRGPGAWIHAYRERAAIFTDKDHKYHGYIVVVLERIFRIRRSVLRVRSSCPWWSVGPGAAPLPEPRRYCRP